MFKKRGNKRIFIEIITSAMEQSSQPCDNPLQRDLAVLDYMISELQRYRPIPIHRVAPEMSLALYRGGFTCVLGRFLINLKTHDLATSIEYFAESCFSLEVFREDRIAMLLEALKEAKEWVLISRGNDGRK